MWNIWHVPHSGTCQYIYNTIFCVVYSTIQYLLYTIQYFALFNSFTENYPTHYFSFNMIFCETLFRNSPRSSIEFVIFLFVWTCNSLNVTFPVTPEDKTIQLKAMRLKISHLWHVAHLFFYFQILKQNHYWLSDLWCSIMKHSKLFTNPPSWV